MTSLELRVFASFFTAHAIVLVILALQFNGCGFGSRDGMEGCVETNCQRCHGGGGSPAPPFDVAGRSSTDEIGVGAHRAHLGTSDWHAEIGCAECHVVPTCLDDEGHIDTAAPAELTWGGLATADEASPSFSRGDATCSGAYCHGATLASGTLTTPVWTVVDGTQAACGTCHGLPPGAPHTDSGDCGMCHGSVIDSSLSWVDPGLHINGRVDVGSNHPEGWTDPGQHGAGFLEDPSSCRICHGDDLSGGFAGVSCETCHPGFRTDCTFCHGGTDNATGAPPVDLTGATQTSLSGVGAHTSHVSTASTWHADIACSSCHLVPEEALTVGHIDPGPVEVVWGGIADADGSVPLFDGTACSGVYCHGSSLFSGGSLLVPVWTTVDGSQAACGACHGLPPDPPHVTDTSCVTCHGSVVDSGMSFVAPELHINGVVNLG
ncbi:MAG: CxxxxCH/CxxCH domain-containing protein [Deltaproteobacteria bacterium]|nr:CxxxxCH/CxxCH domain-containing protein [Deltaproteobacteria bacterium]